MPMKIKNTLCLAIALSFPTFQAMAAPVLNVDKDAKALICDEKVTVLDKWGNRNGTVDNGAVMIVDYGDAFFVVSKTANAVAYSGKLTQEYAESIQGQPTPGVTMMRGIGTGEGTFGYLKNNFISWDCRK
jgi:hypothetical protein